MRYLQTITNFLREFREISEHARTGRRPASRQAQPTDLSQPR
ncbi:hypothetical protein [Chelativorans sp. YIM 93263]|nr:hypothetical protein [Chelativorans sp. YIM 93263]